MHGTPSLKPSRPAWKKSGKNSSTNSDEVYFVFVFRYACDAPIRFPNTLCHGVNIKVRCFESYHSIRAVHTDPPTDQYADHPLPSGTVDWGCFRPVTTRNQPVTIDFDHRRLLLGSISQGKKKREKKSEKKWENLEIRRCSPGSRSISHKLLGASRGESLAITGRRKRRWTYGLLAKALWGDFFPVHGLLREKE
ncbi:hypothetical protein GW17_00038424 [Ensete ventricosum]|nr:hypothetical protein GW17_00038424 [Ensete ventricosum]RZS04272.1 hypothetical protein BHM03_00034582 [Ensete ventricosum]